MRSRNCIWQNRMLTTAQCEMGNCIVALDCGKIEIESWNCVCSEVRWSFTRSSNFSQAKEPPAPQQRQPRGLTAWLGYRLLHINASVMWQFVWKAVQTRGTHTHTKSQPFCCCCTASPLKSARWVLKALSLVEAAGREAWSHIKPTLADATALKSEPDSLFNHLSHLVWENI